MTKTSPVLCRARAVRILGVYEAVGGVAGGAFMVVLAIRAPYALPWGSLPFALLPFLALGAAGGALLRGKSYGTRLSVLAQLSQVAAFVLPVGVWKFSAGPYVAVAVPPSTFGWGIGFDVSLIVGAMLPADEPQFALNLVPILCLLLLLWLYPIEPSPSAKPLALGGRQDDE